MHKCKLSDCVKEINNRTTENNQYEVLTSSKNGIFSQEEYFDKQVASKDNTGYKIIKKGQFTYRSMSDSGTFTINRLEDKDIGIVSPAYPVFEATNINAEFLKYYFKSELFNKAIINLSQGSTRTALKFKDLIDIEIYLPEIEEQKKIVKILKNNDQIIEKYDKLIKEKEQFIKSQFVEMLRKIKNIEYKKLEELVLFQNGINASAEKYGKGTKCISVMDILNNSYIDYKLIKGSVEVTKEQSKNYEVSYGDILFVRSSENLKDAGKSNIYTDKKIDAVFGGFVIRGKKNYQYNPYYINMALKENTVRQQMMKYAAGTQHINIGQENLKKVTVPICDLKIQNTFEKLYKLIDKQKFNYINKVKLLKEIINIFLGGKKI